MAGKHGGARQAPRVWRSLIYCLPLLLAALMVWASNQALDRFPELNEQQGRLNDALWMRLPRIPPDKRIVLVTIDKQSKSQVTDSRSDVGFPRSDYARLISVIDKASPTAIGVDVDFHEKSLKGDVLLNSVLAANTAPPVVIASQLKPGDPPENLETAGAYEGSFEPMGHLANSRVVFGSVVNYSPNLEAIGCVPLRTDFTTGLPIPHLAVALAAYGLGGDPKQAMHAEDMSLLRIGTTEWRLGADQEVLARWTPNYGDFEQYDFNSVMNASADVNRKRFEKKLVLIGDVRPGIDMGRTPAFGPRPGVYFIAQMVNTFLMPPSMNSAWVPLWAQNTLAFVIAATASFCLLCGRKLFMIAGPVVLVGLGMTLPTLTTHFASLFIEALSLTLPTIATTAVSAMFLAFKAGRFDTRLAGEIRQGTVLFVDVTGSTAMTRELGARGYQHAFTDFMKRAAPEVTGGGGEVERTTGDGFVALFTDRGHANSALMAYETALRVIRCADQTSQEIGRSFEVVAGLESGPMSGGFVAEKGVKSWSTTGNTVNLTARLLGACADFGVRMAVGPTAAKMLEEDVRLRKVGQFLPKGFEDEVTVYSEP